MRNRALAYGRLLVGQDAAVGAPAEIGERV